MKSVVQAASYPGVADDARGPMASSTARHLARRKACAVLMNAKCADTGIVNTSMRDVDSARLRHEYQDFAPVGKRFGVVLVRGLRQMMSRNGTGLEVPIEHRVKS